MVRSNGRDKVEGRKKKRGGGDNASGFKKDNVFESTSTGRKEEEMGKGDNDNILMGGG